MPEQVEARELTFAQLYEQLVIHEDIFCDHLPEEQYSILRKGLSSYKTKNNEKLKKNGMPTEDRMINFEVTASYATENTIKVRVWFNRVNKIETKIIPADGELK